MNAIVGIMVSFDNDLYDNIFRFGFIRDIPIVLNSSSNPVIYFMTNSSYRRVFRASIMKCLGTIRRGKRIMNNRKHFALSLR